MRRTLAIVGAAVLAAGFTGLAGPASADPGVSQSGDVVVHEVGAELDTTLNGGVLEGGYVEFINNGTTDANVGGFEVIACTAGATFAKVLFDIGTTIPAGDTLLIADPDYNAPFGGTPDDFFQPGDILKQQAGGVQLVDPASSSVLDEIMWGPDSPGVECAETNAGVLPSDTQSINRSSPTWDLLSPTPEGLND